MNRVTIAAGTIPPKTDPSGELRWLRADAAAAHREFKRWGGHDAECRALLADFKVERFLQQHPEVA